MTKILTSSIVRQQLPEFIRSEYPIFVTFLEKYYEWMELSGNALAESDKLSVINDIDVTPSYYLEQIKKEFLPFFPDITSIDSRKFIKLVSNFYSAKGTPASVKFLFKALYNEDIDIFYPKDDILKASDGKWVLPLALRIDTDDTNILNIEQTLLTGTQSKATALVEKVVRSVDRQLGIVYIEVYVSNVEKLFITGETVTATYNNGVVDVTVSGKLIGALSEIKIDPLNRGLLYNGYNPDTGYPGDPLTIVGGLNPESNTPVGAIAFVGATTQGSITDILTVNGGFGFRDPVNFPNSSIIDISGGFTDALFGTEAKADISLIDLSNYRTMNVSQTSIEVIQSITLENVSANIITSNIRSISSYQTLNVSPIAFVALTGSGGGYKNLPDVNIYSYYNEQNPDVLIINTTNAVKGTNVLLDFSQNLTVSFQVGDVVRLTLANRYDEISKVTAVTTDSISLDKIFENDINGISVYKVTRSDLYNLGSLGRVEIVNPGTNYQVGEYLVFTGGSGYGANARISQVYANNGISKVDFVEANNFVVGGEGYYADKLPTITITTASGSNAVLRISEVSGDGEQLSLTTSRIGAISSIRVISFGYDYVSPPSVSLRNADLVLRDVTPGLLFVANTKIYQGSSNSNFTFSAFVDSFDPDTNFIRIFDYIGTLNTSSTLKSDDDLVTANIVSSVFYGDGRAKVSAEFENGLIRYPGLYLNTDGHVSSDKRLQDGFKYHNFSYVINTKQDYETFREPLNQIVHPLGTKTFVNKIVETTDVVTSNVDDIIYLEYPIVSTFNVTNSTLNMLSTNSSINVAASVNVGDYVILNSVVSPFGNVASVNTSSNILSDSANNFNFVNLISEEDDLLIYRGITFEQEKDVSGQETALTGVTFNNSGNTMYIVGSTGDDITYYNLSSPWNVSTATLVTQSSLSAQTTIPSDIFFKYDGTKLWITSEAPTANIITYSLSQPWNVQTISVETSQSLNVRASSTNPRSIYWKPDGTSFYIASAEAPLDDTIIQYTTSETWNVAAATLTDNLSITSQEINVSGITFSDDGTKLFMVGSTNNQLNYYRLSIPWRISSATFIRSFVLPGTTTGINYQSSANKLYITLDTGSAANTNKVLQYAYDFNDDIQRITSIDDYFTITTQNTFNYTSNNVYIDKIFSDSKRVLNVNTTTILVDTRFSTNTRFASVSVRKAK
jgi:hypothetical protein